ncbi:hypothetical protein TRIUR3_31720 [Triticum urartu]|uniref:Uncharacterized protein n=1 Tax=Triticum urartu TaxID=4572 RepID=M7YAR5_TRIUA|nr:hypothetical protein TRIUR3_31720 [Triticum urartu]
MAHTYEESTKKQHSIPSWLTPTKGLPSTPYPIKEAPPFKSCNDLSTFHTLVTETVRTFQTNFSRQQKVDKSSSICSCDRLTRSLEILIFAKVVPRSDVLRVIWLSGAEKGKGYAVGFLDITLHAVSRDPEAYPSPCLYTQIEAEADSDEEDGDFDSEAGGDSQLPKISEMRIILADAAQQENEDSDLFHGGDMTNGGWIHGDEDEHMVDGIDPEFFIPIPIGQNGGDDLSSSVLELQINDQRFEDADEEEARENGH